MIGRPDRRTLRTRPGQSRGQTYNPLSTPAVHPPTNGTKSGKPHLFPQFVDKYPKSLKSFRVSRGLGDIDTWLKLQSERFCKAPNRATFATTSLGIEIPFP